MPKNLKSRSKSINANWLRVKRNGQLKKSPRILLETILGTATAALLPEKATPKERMAHKLNSPEAAALYSLRKQTVESAFGIITHAMHFRQFLMRGKEDVTGEWKLVCTAYNLKRIFKLIKAQAATALSRDMAPNA